MSFPELAIQVGVVIVRVGAVKMCKIAPEEAGHQHDSSERGEGGSAFRTHNIGKCESLFGFASHEGVFGGR